MMDEIDALRQMPTWHPTQDGCVTSVLKTLISTLIAFHLSLMIYISDLGHLKINHDINFFFKLFKVVFNHMPHLFVDNDFLA
jgi:hypothetical protein